MPGSLDDWMSGKVLWSLTLLNYYVPIARRTLFYRNLALGKVHESTICGRDGFEIAVLAVIEDTCSDFRLPI